MSMLEDLAGAIGGENLGHLAKMFGTDNDVMGRAVASALPALLGGLARNAREPQGARALNEALSKDHDGSILDSLGSIFGGSPWAQQQATRHGESILGHVFGNQRPRVEQQVQQTSGLSGALVRQLLPILAPIVLGYIGKRMRGEGANDARLTESLQHERAQVQQNDSMFGQVLDMLDTDEADQSNGGLMDVAGDLLKGAAGRAILGKLLGG